VALALALALAEGVAVADGVAAWLAVRESDARLMSWALMACPAAWLAAPAPRKTATTPATTAMRWPVPRFEAARLIAERDFLLRAGSPRWRATGRD
jgi:hypothetical protein